MKIIFRILVGLAVLVLFWLALVLFGEPALSQVGGGGVFAPGLGTSPANNFVSTGTAKFGGVVTFTNSPFQISVDQPIYINRVTGPSISSFYSELFGENLAFIGGTAGFMWTDKTGNKRMSLGVDGSGNLEDGNLRLYTAKKLSLDPNNSDIMSLRAGIVASAYIPFISGSVSMAGGMPVHKDEMARRAPRQLVEFYVGGVYATELFLTSNITIGTASGVIPTLQSFGAQMEVDLEPGWNMNTRDPNDLTLRWNTNSFADGPVLLTRKMHTNGFWVGLHQYVSSVVTNDNLIVNDGYLQPATSLNFITKDVKKFYDWGVDAFRVADETTFSAPTTTAWQEALTRLINDEVLHPRGVDYTAWAGYTNTMHTEYYLGGGSLALPDSAAYEVIAYYNDQGLGAGSGVARANDQMRISYTNYAWMAGQGHYVGACIFSGGLDSASTTPWANVQHCQANLIGNIMFPSTWVLSTFTNVWWNTYVGTITNAGALKMAFDRAYAPAARVYDTGIGGSLIYVKPLANGDFALAFGNETGATINMTFDWSTNYISDPTFLPTHHSGRYPFEITSNLVFTVTDIYNGTNQTVSNGRFTASVTNNSTVLFRMSRGGIIGNSDWVTSVVSGSDATTTGQSLVDVTGLSFAAAANTTYAFEAKLYVTTSAVTTGTQYGLANVGTAMTCNFSATGATNAATGATYCIQATNSATQPFLLASGQSGEVRLEGTFTMGATAGNVTIRHLKNTSGTSTVKQGSEFRVRKLF